MAIIDLVRWSPQGDETIFAWRFPHTNLSTYTQLIVQESQEAVLFSKGQIMGKFGPGKHTLNTENLPILRSLYGIPFGGKNPFTAEVWFVNRIQTFSIDWYIDRMAIHDADYNTQLPLTASGQYGLQVTDAEKFLVKIVGTRSEYTQEDLTEQFTGEFTTKTKSTIVQYMLKHRVGFKQISAYLDMLSEYLRGAMNPFWDALGLRLNKFYVSTIDISDATPEDRRVKEAISQQAAMSITGHTWQQEQMFDTAKSAIGGLGDNTGGLLGGLLAVQMMGGLGNGAAPGMMQPQYNQPTFGGPGAAPQPGMQPGRRGGQDGLLLELRKEVPEQHALLPPLRRSLQSLPPLRYGQRPECQTVRQLRGLSAERRGRMSALQGSARSGQHLLRELRSGDCHRLGHVRPLRGSAPADGQILPQMRE